VGGLRYGEGTLGGRWKVKRLLAEVDPNGVVTTTEANPGVCIGDRYPVIVVLVTIRSPSGAPPIVTEVAPVNPVPVMVSI